MQPLPFLGFFLFLLHLVSPLAMGERSDFDEKPTWWNVVLDAKLRRTRLQLDSLVERGEWSEVTAVAGGLLEMPQKWTLDEERGVVSSYDLAKAALDKARKQIPDLVESELKVGARRLLAEANKNLDEETLAAVISRYPSTEQGKEALKMVLARASNTDSALAVDYAQRVLSAEPNNLTNKVKLAQAYMFNGDKKAADAILKPIEEQEIKIAGKARKVKDLHFSFTERPKDKYGEPLPQSLSEIVFWEKVDKILNLPKQEQVEEATQLVDSIDRASLQKFRGLLAAQEPLNEDRLAQLDGMIQLRRAEKLQPLARLPSPTCIVFDGKPTALKEVADSANLLVQTDSKISLLGEDGKSIHTLNTEGMSFINLRPDGKRFVAIQDGELKEYDALTLRPLRTIEKPNKPLTCVEYSSDGQYILAGNQAYEFMGFDSEAGALQFKHPTGQQSYGRIRSIGLDRNKTVHVYFAGNSRATASYDILGGKERGLDGGGYSANFNTSFQYLSPSGVWRAEANDDNVKVSNYPPNRIFSPLNEKGEKVISVQFAPADNAVFLLNSEGRIKRWPLEGRNEQGLKPEYMPSQPEGVSSITVTGEELLMGAKGKICRTPLAVKAKATYALTSFPERRFRNEESARKSKKPTAPPSGTHTPSKN